MAVSQFLPFAWHAGANVMPQAQYEANPAVVNGYAAGIARSREANKTWRQATMGVAALTWLIPDVLNEDAEDNGDRPRLTDQLRRMVYSIALSAYPADPPDDGVSVYGRRGNQWVLSVGEAPIDNLVYGRWNGSWTRVPSWGDLVGGFLPLTGGTLAGPGNLAINGWLDVAASFNAQPGGNVWVGNNLTAGSINSSSHVVAGTDLHAGAVLYVGGIPIYNDGTGWLYTQYIRSGAGIIGGITLDANSIWMAGSVNAGGAVISGSVNIGGYVLYNDGGGSLYVTGRLRGTALQSDSTLLVGGIAQFNTDIYVVGRLRGWGGGTWGAVNVAQGNAISFGWNGSSVDFFIDGGYVASTVSGGAFLPLTGGSLSGPGNLQVNGSFVAGWGAIIHSGATINGGATINNNLTVNDHIACYDATAGGGMWCQRFQAVNYGYGTHEAGHFEGNDGGRDVVRVVNNAGGMLMGFFFPNLNLVGSITSNGSSSSFNTMSDIRLKTDIEPLAVDYASTVLAAIQPITFHWKNQTGDEYYHGVAAQELQEVYPEAVTCGKGHPGEEDYRPWSVDLSKLIPVMVTELRELRRIVTQLSKS
jgi:hypothetical protein